jgi:hypothetical protein
VLFHAFQNDTSVERSPFYRCEQFILCGVNQIPASAPDARSRRITLL